MALSDNLLWRIGDAVVAEAKTPAEKIAHVEAMLSEFHALALGVATALINGQSAQSAHDAAKALKEDRTQEQATLTKSLTKTTTDLDAVQRSLDESKEQVSTEQTKHAEVSKTLETTQKTLQTTQAELEDAQTKLEAAEKSVIARDNRKARVYSPFGALQWAEASKDQPEAKKSVRDAWMADMGLAVEKHAQEAQ